MLDEENRDEKGRWYNLQMIPKPFNDIGRLPGPRLICRIEVSELQAWLPVSETG